MFHPLRSSPRRRIPALIMAGFVLLIAAGLWNTSSQSGDRLRGEAVRVCLRVIAAGDDPDDVADCGDITLAASSASSASSSTAAAAASSAATTSASDTEHGGRRYSIEHSNSEIVKLLQSWALRHNIIHAAPSENAGMPFADMEPDAWYLQSIRSLIERGILDSRERYLRPHQGATRSEVAVLFTQAFTGSGTIRPDPEQHFLDVRRQDPDFIAIEYTASRSWMLGYDDCYGSRFCVFRPQRVISRAEAAHVIIRVLSLPTLHRAPMFKDVPPYAWYVPVMQTAADHCILQGDGYGFVRPADYLTRAELFAMIDRAMSGLQYGEDCRTRLAVRAHGTMANGPLPDSLRPAAATSTMPCMDGPLRCFQKAFRADAGRFGSMLLSFLPAGAQSFLKHPPSEWIIPFLLILVILIMSHWMYRRLRQKPSSESQNPF